MSEPVCTHNNASWDRVATMHVVAVVGGQQRSFQLAGDLDEHRVGAFLLGDALVLDLDEQVVAPEDLL